MAKMVKRMSDSKFFSRPANVSCVACRGRGAMRLPRPHLCSKCSGTGLKPVPLAEVIRYWGVGTGFAGRDSWLNL